MVWLASEAPYSLVSTSPWICPLMLDLEDGTLLSRLGVTDVLCVELLLVSTLPNGFPELSYCLYAATFR